VEVASFVNPKLVPAMAGAEEVMEAIGRREDVSYSALVLNERGYERALAAGVDDVRFGFAVTDEFGQRNQNQTTAQGLEIARTLVRRAHDDGNRIGVTLIVSLGCPFAGAVEPSRVIALVEELMEDPPDDIALADTIGVAVPTQVTALVKAARETGATVGAHFHNTRNTGFANAVAAIAAGVSIVDGSVGGTGGCPFAPRATGNIATEDLVYLLHGMGIRTGIDLSGLIEVSDWLSNELGKQLPGLLAKAGVFTGVPA
jgi:hydroxymethylglutaryl-CoA lyase/(R)-citramalyl-CoA lyase